MTKPEDRVRALVGITEEQAPDRVVRSYLSRRGGDVWLAAKDIRRDLAAAPADEKVAPSPASEEGGR